MKLMNNLVALRHAAVNVPVQSVTVLHIFNVGMAYCVLHEKRLLRRRQSFHCIFDFVVGAAGQRPERRHTSAVYSRRASFAMNSSAAGRGGGIKQR